MGGSVAEWLGRRSLFPFRIVNVDAIIGNQAFQNGRRHICFSLGLHKVGTVIKQLLDSVFVISRIIKVSVRVISLSLWLCLIPLTPTLIILDITKTSSNNNCL